jgi:F0F1-type ATP synthase assembly protein I
MEAQKTSAVSGQMHQSHGSFELVASPVILALGGWWIDGRLGTGPWLMVLGVVLGVVGAVTKLVIEYRVAMTRHADSRVGS